MTTTTEIEETTPPDPEDPETRHAIDRATRALGFRVWLMDEADGRFDELRAAVEERPDDFPIRWDADEWMTALDHDPELVSLLMLAEVEWRVEMSARKSAASSLAVITTPGMDFRSPGVIVKGCMFRKRVPRGSPSEPICGRSVIPGTVRCERHGGELVDLNTRRAVLMSVYLQLVDASTLAVEALADVAENGKNEIARVMASKEILDRVGLAPDININITDATDGRVASLMEKLASMREGIMARVIDVESKEVTEEEPDHEVTVIDVRE